MNARAYSLSGFLRVMGRMTTQLRVRLAVGILSSLPLGKSSPTPRLLSINPSPSLPAPQSGYVHLVGSVDTKNINNKKSNHDLPLTTYNCILKQLNILRPPYINRSHLKHIFKIGDDGLDEDDMRVDYM